MKKVLFVATIARHIIGFHIPYLKWFKEHGYEVHVASSGDEEIEYCDKHYKLPFKRFPIQKENIKVYKELKKIIETNKYEIVHCHTPVGGVLTRLAARNVKKQGTKVIYTAHGFHFYKGAPKINWMIYYPIEKLMAKYTDCLITITKEDYEFAKKKFKKVKEIEHVNGVGMNTERFNIDISDEDKKQLKKEFNIKENDIVLAYVAELNRNKNQTLLINAIQKVIEKNKKVKLLLIGEGITKEEYIKIIKEKSLEENVLVLGRRRDVPQILSITDIYVASSIREGLPVNIMEAMYMSLPVVATSNRGHRELVEEGKNGFLANIGDEEKFVNKILELVENQKLREKLGKNGKELVGKYQVENVIEDMKKIYSKQKKRVVHVLNTGSYSGAENVAITIINNMNKYENYENFYASPEGKIKEILEKNKINYIPLKKVNTKEIKRICKEHKPDIIHAHDFTASIMCAFVGGKAKIISHIHNNSPWIKKYGIYSFIYLFSSLKYKKILTVSDSVTNEYVFGKNIKKKVEMIGNPIDTDYIVEKSKENNGNDKEYDIIFIGRLVEPKDPLRFIDIVKEIKSKKENIRVAMLGDGALKTQCIEKIKEYNLKNNIDILGFIDNPYSILAKSKILCNTSIWEGYGLVLIEALTLGKPVVAPNVGGIPSIVNEKCGKICNNNEEFIEEIMLLLNNKEKYDIKHEEAFKRAQEINNINKYMKKINDIYTNVKSKGE